MSLFVLLPASAHSNQPIATSRVPPRPSPLVTRQSGGAIPSLGSLSAMRIAQPFAKPSPPETAEIDKVVNAGRRLSLAPGMGAGTQRSRVAISTLDTVHSSPEPGSSVVFNEPASDEAESSSVPTTAKAPVFGSGSSSSGGRFNRRRPQTSAQSSMTSSVAGPVSRGSIAVPSRGGGLLGAGKTRPGWEGDELVGMLRGSGLEGECLMSFVCFETCQVPSHLV